MTAVSHRPPKLAQTRAATLPTFLGKQSQIISAIGMRHASRFGCWPTMVVAVLATLLLMPLASGASAQADTALPGALWTAPMGLPGATAVAPDGDALVASCETSGNPSELVDQRLTSDGTPLWQLFRSEADPGGCPGLVSDAGGNTYLLGFDSQQHSVAQSVDHAGHSRWATPTGNASGGGNSPVLGANGSVFFEGFDGLGAFVLGFDTASGTATYHQNLAGIAGLHAYQSGLAEVSDYDGVAYYGYDGSLTNLIDPTPAITNSEPSSNAGGAAGTVFMAGYGGDCHGSYLSVSKITPAGRAWTWTDTSAACGGPSIAATPDGGVVLSVSTGQTDGSVIATSLSADGVLRWQQTIAGAERNGINQVLVDANGVVTLQSHDEYPDPSNPSVLHLGVEAQFLSAQTGQSVFPTIEATDPDNGDFQMSLGGGVSIGTGRVYIPESGSASINSVSAYSVPGLGQDYQSVLQASLTSSSGGGGSPPEGGDGEPPIVQPPLGPPSPPPPAPSSNPCAISHGSLVHNLLESLKCTAEQTKLEVECGFAIALLRPLKGLDALKTAAGFYDLRKIKRSVRPIAKLYNDIKRAKFSKHAPAGFRTWGEVINKIHKAHSAWAVVKLLPNIAKAVSVGDFSQFALDMDEILGLKPCVQGIVNALG